MPLTVRDLLDDPELGLELLVDGDPDRQVRWVHTTELADPSRYLQGGEVILTTGVWMDAGLTAPRFVRPLADARIAALGYGLPSPTAVTPPELIRACRSRSLMLFTVPFELPFIAIGERFVDRLSAEREAPLLTTLRRNAQLVRAAESGSGLDGVLRVLQRSHEIRSWVIGPGRRVLAACDTDPSAEDVEQVAGEASRLQAEYPVAVGDWLLFPIVAVGRTEAHLVVGCDTDPQPIDLRAAIDQALPFLGLELARRRAVRESERRFAAELIDLVSAGPAQAAAASARLGAFGVDPLRPTAGLVCEVSEPDVAVERVESVMADRGIPSVVASRGAEVVAIAGWDAGPDDLLDLARTLRGQLGEGTAVGVGSVAPTVEGLRTSLIEARQACRFARLRRREAGYATHDEIGSHTLLLALQDEAVLEAFRNALLQPLEEQDARRHTHLVETLDVFLGCGGRWQQTAAALHVHVNTLRHRLARIEKLTGRSLSSMEDRVDFFIALRARPS